MSQAQSKELMTRILIETTVKGHFQNVFAQFNHKLFEQLAPPEMNLVIERFDGQLKNNEIHLKIGVAGFYLSWISIIANAFSLMKAKKYPSH